MNIKGIHKTSLIDYPGKISSILFTGGCNLRCRYCHNPALACNDCGLGLSNDEAYSIIERRKDLIDGVSITGGEPTLARNIDGFIGSLRKLGLSVKIDTNGLNPPVIERLLEKKMLDYVAIDVKTSPEKYNLLTGRIVDFSLIRETIDIVRDHGVEYEIRTTCIPNYLTFEDVISIGKAIGRVKRYFLQQFVNDVTLDEEFSLYEPYPLEVLESYRDYILTFSDFCSIRGV